MKTIEQIDVTILEPKLKHPSIFKKFDEIEESESFIILNDHDPKPLYYQLIGERGNVFSWEYLENGPDNWKVKIKKNPSIENEKSIGELVASDFRKAEVFKKFNIDFCCGGKKSVSQICKENDIDIKKLEAELYTIETLEKNNSHKFNDWSLDFLVDYIVNNHHNYVKSALPTILEYTKKVATVHGEKHAETITIYELFNEVAHELESHMAKEEQVLFPYIKLLISKNPLTAKEDSVFGSVQNPIRMMEHEHDVVGNILKKIKKLSNNYTPPEDACTTYKITFQKLQEFEDDLLQHIHLENNILFPKSIKLESSI